jgi:hypothetical protein
LRDLKPSNKVFFSKGGLSKREIETIMIEAMRYWGRWALKIKKNNWNKTRQKMRGEKISWTSEQHFAQALS